MIRSWFEQIAHKKRAILWKFLFFVFFLTLYKRATVSNLLRVLMTKDREQQFALFHKQITLLLKKPMSDFPTLQFCLCRPLLALIENIKLFKNIWELFQHSPTLFVIACQRILTPRRLTLWGVEFFGLKIRISLWKRIFQQNHLAVYQGPRIVWILKKFRKFSRHCKFKQWCVMPKWTLHTCRPRS